MDGGSSGDSVGQGVVTDHTERNGMTSQEPEKHTLYFEVLDAIHEAQDCPLCYLEADRMRKYLDSLLYEFVNDPGVRKQLARSRGFCQTHAHQIANVEGPHALGIAILYHDQVNQFLTFLERLKQPTIQRFWKRRRRNSWESSEPCPACALGKEQRLRYADVLVRSMNEPDFRAAYEVSAGLCVPHFLFAIDRVQEQSLRDFLITIQQARFSDLKHSLEEFCRKNDYRFRDEAIGKESDSWMRAIKKMVGNPSI